MTADSGPTDAAFDPIDFLEAAVATPSHEDVDPMRELVVETLADRGVDARIDGAGNVIAVRGPTADVDRPGEAGDVGSSGDAIDAEDSAAGSDAGDSGGAIDVGDSGGAIDVGDSAAGSAGGSRADAAVGPHVVLNTHLDTVTPHVPLEWADDGERLRGRGACDAKGPLAALLAAFLAVDPGAGRLTLAVTPDEEARSTGAHALVSEPGSPIVDADAVIVGEPTGLDVCTAAKGRFQGTVELRGANAHAAEPESGTNAVAALEGVLRAIRSFDDRLGAPEPHPDLGEPTLTPTVVAGGEATNQVPASCRLTLDRRSVPPETADSFRAALLEHLRDAIAEPVAVDFAFADRPTPFLEAWSTDADDPLVRTLAAASGGDVRPFGAATEASYFAALAPTVVFGPGALVDDEGAVAHASREYVRPAAVEAAADALTRAIRALLGGRAAGPE